MSMRSLVGHRGAGVVAAAAVVLSACGPGEPSSVTLGLCDDIPGTIVEMERMRDSLEDGNFATNVTGVVTDTHDLLQPMFEDARRAVASEDFEPYEQVGAYVRGSWLAYVEMDTVDFRPGYLSYTESIRRLRLAEQACDDLDEHT